MTTRNLTQKFEQLRGDLRSRRTPRTKARPDHLLSDTDDSGATGLGLEHSLPPGWVDIVEGIQKDLGKAKEYLRTLQQLHTDRLKVTFGADKEAEKDKEIEVVTGQITTHLKTSERSLKRIAIIGNEGNVVLPQEERVVRLNVMRSLGVEINSLSKQFRQCQKDFVGRIKGQDDKSFGKSVFNDEDSKQPLSIEEAIDRGFTPEQLRQMQTMQQVASDRDQQIIKIAQSVNELAQVFKELNVLVIEQGTILDRIDYNMEQTLIKVKSGVKELVKAEEYSRKNRALKCIICLMVIITILGIILGVKKSNSGK